MTIDRVRPAGGSEQQRAGGIRTLWVAQRSFVGGGLGNLLPGMATVVGMNFGWMQTGSENLVASAGGVP